jgi:hypothetical protein
VLVFKDYRQGDTFLTTERHVLRFAFNAGLALRATSRSYFRLWAAGVWRREDFAPVDSAAPGSIFGTVGAGIEVARSRFHVLERFNTYARREDVNLSEYLRIGLWAAPRAWGYSAGHAGIGPDVSAQVSAVWRGGFIVLSGVGHALYAGTALDSARVRGGVTVTSQNFAGQTVIAHFEGGALRGATRITFFDPWQDQTGHACIPPRSPAPGRRFIRGPDRPEDQAFGLVGVGVAPFFDWGVRGGDGVVGRLNICFRAAARGMRPRRLLSFGPDPGGARRSLGTRGRLPVRRPRGSPARLGAVVPPGHHLLASAHCPNSKRGSIA